MKKYNISFEYFSGVDGRLDERLNNIYKEYQLKDVNDPSAHPVERRRKNKIIKSVGAFGYLESMINILKDAKKNNYKKILVFDDDVFFNKNLDKYLKEIHQQIDNQYKLLYFGSSQYVLPDNIPVYGTGLLKYMYTYPCTDGSFAVGYDHSIYDELINLASKYNAPFDSGPLRNIIERYPKKCITIYPNIIIPDTTDFSKTLGLRRDLRSHAQKVKWDLNEMDYTRAFWKVSIIVANHNSEKYIKQTIDSVINQTYKNIELLIIDDHSTDNCLDIIRPYTKDHEWIKLHVMETNGGAYKCRNHGLDISTGMFIKLLDADDILLSRAVEQDVENYIKNPDYEVFFSNIYRSNHTVFTQISDTKILDQIHEERKDHLNHNTKIYGHNCEWKYKFRFGLPTIFVHRSFFDKYGQWNDNYRYGMDLELIQRYLVLKYNEFVDDQILWKTIYMYNASKYGIYLSKTMDYVSQPMDQNNATSVCRDLKRRQIHEQCNEKLKQMLKQKPQIRQTK